MMRELKDLKIELMVSIWPTVDKLSSNYEEMLTDGLLVRVERGHRTTMDFQGDTVFFDATHPQSRDFVWKTAKKNYFDLGIKTFWLDEAEPEYSNYDFEMFRVSAVRPGISVHCTDRLEQHSTIADRTCKSATFIHSTMPKPSTKVRKLQVNGTLSIYSVVPGPARNAGVPSSGLATLPQAGTCVNRR